MEGEMTVLIRGFSFVKVSCRLGTAKKHGQIDLVNMAYEDVQGGDLIGNNTTMMGNVQIPISWL